MNRFQTTLNAMLAGMLLVALLPVGHATSDPATTPQEAAIQGLLPPGSPGPAGGLANNWQVRNELHTVYIDSDKTLTYVRGDLPSGEPQEHLLVNPANPDTSAVPEVGAPPQPTDFTMDYGKAVSDFEMSAMGGTFFLASSTAYDVDLQLLVDMNNDDDLSDAEDHVKTVSLSMSGLLVSPTAPGQGVITIPDPTGELGFDFERLPFDSRGYSIFTALPAPQTVLANQRFGFRLHAVAASDAGDGDTVEFAYGSRGGDGLNTEYVFDSRIQFTGDLSRVNAWTEKSVGTNAFLPTQSFPAPGSSDVNDRTIHLRLAHINAPSERALDFHRHIVSVVGPDNKVYYHNAPAALGAGTPSLVNVDPSLQWGAANDYPADPASTGEGLRYASYLMTYPPNLALPSGVYKITVSAARGPAWTVEVPVVVGSAGSGLALLASEVNAKEILVGERTTFRILLTNIGGAVDTFALSAQPGTTLPGWAASVAPAQVALDPGKSIEAVVTVVPSTTGHNGDENTIAVTATSLNSGRAQSLDVNPATPTVVDHIKVKLTTTKQTLAPALIVPSSVIAVGPGGSRLVPVAVVNNGNTEDRFIISTQGAPAGWNVGVSPGLLELDAQSQGASILRVEAPATATRGQVFDLTVRASRLDDLAAKAEQVFQVRVFAVDKFTFAVLDEQGNVVTTTTAQDPVLHSLRDEGPDAVVSDGSDDPLGFFGGGSTPWDGNPNGATSAERQDADADYDQTTLFRLVLKNEGDNPDTIRLVPKLLTSTTGFSTDLLKQYSDGTTAGATALRNGYGFRDSANCEGSGSGNTDGINDGWRVRIFDPATIPAFSDGKQNYQAVEDLADGALEAIPLAPGQTKFIYVEMKWILPVGGNCPDSVEQGTERPQDPSDGHALAIEAISQKDPSQRNTHFLNTKLVRVGEDDRVSSQRYEQQVNGVILEPDLSQMIAKTVGEQSAAASKTTYRLRAVNSGNEMDFLRITVPQCQGGTGATCDGGWRYNLPNTATTVDHTLGFPNELGRGGSCTGPTVSGGQVALECHIGAFDEVTFTVEAQADIDTSGTGTARVPLGSFNTARVQLTSRDSLSGAGTVSESLLLTTRLTGSFVSNLLPDATSTAVDVHPGGTAAVPFTIRNLGTSDDSYSFDLPIAPTSASGWTANFAQANPVFVPAGREVAGYLLVLAPANAAVGSQQTIQVRSTSQDAAGEADQDVFDIVATVRAKATDFTLVGDPANVVQTPGEQAQLTIKSTRAAGNTATDVEFRLDPASLPQGWTHTGAGPFTETYDSEGVARHTFIVTPAEDALGTSRAAVKLTGKQGTTTDFAFVALSLDAPSAGVDITAPDGNDILVAPGAATQATLRIENRGVSLDTVALTAPTVPTGWTVVFESASISVQPLETRFTNVTVTPPADLAAGQTRLVRIAATPSDPTKVTNIDLNFTAGASIPVLAPKSAATIHALPEEPFQVVLTVLNNGTIGDDLVLGMAAASAFKDVATATFEPDTLTLEPGEAKDIVATITLPRGLAAKLDAPLAIEARSAGPFLKAVGTTTLPVKVIDHKVRDIDGDLTNEYAIDRDLDADNGFEGFRDPSVAGALSTVVSAGDLLTEGAKARFTVVTTAPDGNSTSALRFLFDPDADQKADLLVDTDADGEPDVYWDPDRGYSHVIPVLKDVTGDGTKDYFFDLDGEAGLHLDVFYDPAEGRTGRLLQIDIDNNGVLDYVVDSNGNNQPDLSETVLFGGPDGTIASIRETADVDGDGKTDIVIDSDGDGRPDYFVPNGKTAGVPIVLEDVDGDGVDDWTYDSDGDGLRDSYYNPVTKESGLLDSKGDFLGQLAKYWYIGALFGVVLALFVVLLMVTRR